jgi:hypothetical protein
MGGHEDAVGLAGPSADSMGPAATMPMAEMVVVCVGLHTPHEETLQMTLLRIEAGILL